MLGKWTRFLSFNKLNFLILSNVKTRIAFYSNELCIVIRQLVGPSDRELNRMDHKICCCWKTQGRRDWFDKQCKMSQNWLQFWMTDTKEGIFSNDLAFLPHDGHYNWGQPRCRFTLPLSLLLLLLLERMKKFRSFYFTF